MRIGIAFDEAPAAERFDAELITRRQRLGGDGEPSFAMRRFARMAKRFAPPRPEPRDGGEHEIAADRIRPDAATAIDDFVQSFEEDRPRLDPLAPRFRQ